MGRLAEWSPLELARPRFIDDVESGVAVPRTDETRRVGVGDRDSWVSWACVVIGSRSVASSIVMCVLTVPAEARSHALNVLADADAVGRFPGAVVSSAASFFRSGGTEIQDSELIVVSARAEGAPTPALAEDFWRAVESTLFREAVSAVEHMIAYAIPTDG